jgi:hypothetical protein
VEAGPDLKLECPERITDRRGGKDGTGGPIEGGEEPVAGCVEFAALEARLR